MWLGVGVWSRRCPFFVLLMAGFTNFAAWLGRVSTLCATVRWLDIVLS